jgi:hypothetical protein
MKKNTPSTYSVAERTMSDLVVRPSRPRDKSDRSLVAHASRVHVRAGRPHHKIDRSFVAHASRVHVRAGRPHHNISGHLGRKELRTKN